MSPYTSCNHLLLRIDVQFRLTRHSQATAGHQLNNVLNLHAPLGAADYTINSLFWLYSFYGANCWSLILNINIFLKIKIFILNNLNNYFKTIKIIYGQYIQPKSCRSF